MKTVMHFELVLLIVMWTQITLQLSPLISVKYQSESKNDIICIGYLTVRFSCSAVLSVAVTILHTFPIHTESIADVWVDHTNV